MIIFITIVSDKLIPGVGSDKVRLEQFDWVIQDYNDNVREW